MKVYQPPKSALSCAGENLRPRRKEILLIGSLGVLFSAVWAVSIGQDLGWDLRNYQYYSVYAWLHNRITYHIAPGQRQNWLNPLVYVPHYLLIQHAPSLIATAIFGAIAGLNFVLVYLLTRCVVSKGRYGMAVAISLLSASVGVADPVFVEVLGGISSDIIISIFVLAGLLALCQSHRPEINSRARSVGYGLCGLFLGMACGLKLTAFVYIVGLTLTLVVLAPVLQFGHRRFAVYAMGGIFGFLLTGGYWSWFLWDQYSNPIFPYFNSVFQSPWAAPESLRDDRFLPQTVEAAISYPFQWFVGLHTTNENQFYDARFALLAVLLPMVLLALASDRVARRRNALEGRSYEQPLVGRDHFWLIVLFFLTSYVVWIVVFAIQHYLIPASLISGLVLLLTLDRLFATTASKVAVFTSLALFSMVWGKSFPSQRLPYHKDWFGVELTPAVSEPNTLFVMLGDVPDSYVVPFLPDSDRFVRISGNFPLQPRTGLRQMAREIINQHTGPIRSLTSGTLGSFDRLQLDRFGLDLSETGCGTFRSRIDQFTSCPLALRPPPPILAVDPRSQMILWNAPDETIARVYVQKDSDPKVLYAEGSQGDEQETWIVPGHRFVFELVGWDGAREGPLIATATIDEQGNVSSQTFGGGTVPAPDEQAPGRSGDK